MNLLIPRHLALMKATLKTITKQCALECLETCETTNSYPKRVFANFLYTTCRTQVTNIYYHPKYLPFSKVQVHIHFADIDFDDDSFMCLTNKRVLSTLIW